MILVRAAAVLVLGLCLGHGVANAAAFKAWAYMGWWLPQSWRGAPLAQFDRLLFFEIKVAANGSITERNGWPQQWTELRAALKQSQTPLDLTLTLFDTAEFEALFSSATAQAKLLEEASRLSQHEDVAGLQLDFEIYTPLSAASLQGFSAFVKALAQRLHQQTPRRSLSVFFPVGGDSVLYDAPTLAQVDHVVMQAYDAHWRGSKTAGPVAPLRGEGRVTWQKAVAQGLSLGVPRERLLLSFPLYGYEWPVQGPKPRSPAVAEGLAISYAPLAGGQTPEMPWNALERSRQYGASFDPQSGSAYYQYTSPTGQYFEGWYEDLRSLRLKSNYVARERLGGLAFFMLGYDGGTLVDYYLRWRQTRHTR